MDSVRKPRLQVVTADVVDFDEALLDSYSPDLRSELMAEAAMLAQAFAPEGRIEELEAMAKSLSAGKSDAEMERKHARGLAAALRRLARDPWA
jgi:hypothetical protein